MAMFTKQAGAWCDLTARVKVNGAWLKAKTVYMKANGVWRDVSTPPFSWAGALAAGNNDSALIANHTLEIDDGLLIGFNAILHGTSQFIYNVAASFAVYAVLKPGDYEVKAVGGGSAGNAYRSTAGAFRAPGTYGQALSFDNLNQVFGGLGGSAAQLVEDSFTVDEEGLYAFCPGIGGNASVTTGTNSIIANQTKGETVFSAAGATIRANTWNSLVSGSGCQLRRPDGNYRLEAGTNGLTHLGAGGAYPYVGICSFTVNTASTPVRTTVSQAKIGGGGGEGSYFPYGTGLEMGNGAYTSAMRVTQTNCGRTGRGYGAGGGGGGRNNAQYSNGEPGAAGAIFIKKVA